MDNCAQNCKVTTIGETLLCQPEVGNIMDLYAVSIITEYEVDVGHIPRKISAICYLFVRRCLEVLQQCHLYAHSARPFTKPQDIFESAKFAICSEFCEIREICTLWKKKHTHLYGSQLKEASWYTTTYFCVFLLLIISIMHLIKV